MLRMAVVSDAISVLSGNSVPAVNSSPSIRPSASLSTPNSTCRSSTWVERVMLFRIKEPPLISYTPAGTARPFDARTEKPTGARGVKVTTLATIPVIRAQ